MILTISTYKIRKSDANPIRKQYRYVCFDTCLEFEGKTFEQKFNKAFDILKEEINQDRNNNDLTQYESIVICDVFLS